MSEPEGSKIDPVMTEAVAKHFGFEEKKPEPKKGVDYSMPADAAHFAGTFGEI
jgi:hypothetical protein